MVEKKKHLNDQSGHQRVNKTHLSKWTPVSTVLPPSDLLFDFLLFYQSGYLDTFKRSDYKMYFCICIYLFATLLQLQKDAKKKKCRKKWREGLKETIKLMLIRLPQLQFFEGGIKITATDTK